MTVAATRYPAPNPEGGRPWCVELRRRITSWVPEIQPPHQADWTRPWPERPGMWNPRTTDNQLWTPAHGWPTGEKPSTHAYCDGDDLMVTHLPPSTAELVRNQVAWILAVMLVQRIPIELPGRPPAYVVEVINNRQIITAKKPTWRPYGGASPHRDHTHHSITRPGSPLFAYPGF